MAANLYIITSFNNQICLFELVFERLYHFAQYINTSKDYGIRKKGYLLSHSIE